MNNVLALVAAFSIYPIAVLCVALTGPHSKFERRP